MKRVQQTIVFLYGIGIYLVLAWILMRIVTNSGVCPAGADAATYLYKAEELLKQVKIGNFFPHIDFNWYNGVESFRYDAPLSVYILAFFSFLMRGDMQNGYVCMIGFLFMVGAISWLYIGFRYKRPYLGMFLGVLWFLVPSNLYTIFGEGDLARSACIMLLPLLCYCVYSFLEIGKLRYLVGMIAYHALCILCHGMFGRMISIAVAMFLVFYVFIEKNIKRCLYAFLGILCSWMICGAWLLPSMIGGRVSEDAKENLWRYFQNITISLNPMERIWSHNSHMYFGLSFLMIAILGVVLAYRKGKTGFVFGVFLCLCTTNFANIIIRFIPGKQYLGMLQFVPLAVCMILYAFLRWASLRKGIVVFLCLLMLADIIPSVSWIYGAFDGVSMEERMEELEERTLINQAKEVTNQRMALLDLGYLEADGAYVVSGGTKGVKATYGTHWQSAATAENVMQLDLACKNGAFYYLFDRCVELGNDTILVDVSCIRPEFNNVDELDAAAKESGYELIEKNEQYRLYHMDVSGDWGTVSRYQAIGIGSTASKISIYYPCIKETVDTDLNHYTYDELSKYQTIFLSGFTYTDKQAAEDMILKLSQNGVRIVIMADGIPESRDVSGQSFLGVRCNEISFSNGYPDLYTKWGTIYPDLFPTGYEKWDSVVLEGLDSAWGSFEENDKSFDFCGTKNNKNIVFVGLNLTYFYSLTQDKEVGAFLGRAIKLSGKTLPIRKVVPIEITMKKNAIQIKTDRDSVNTGLAYHDVYKSRQEIKNSFHLMVVNKGITNIEFTSRLQQFGIVLSLLGVLFAIALCIYIKKCTKINS